MLRERQSEWKTDFLTPGFGEDDSMHEKDVQVHILFWVDFLQVLRTLCRTNDNGSKGVEILQKLSKLGDREEYEALPVQIINKDKWSTKSRIICLRKLVLVVKVPLNIVEIGRSVLLTGTIALLSRNGNSPLYLDRLMVTSNELGDKLWVWIIIISLCTRTYLLIVVKMVAFMLCKRDKMQLTRSGLLRLSKS